MDSAHNSGVPNDLVITVEASRDRSRRSEDDREASQNDAATLGEWLLEEAAWLVAQFVKVAVSVAAFRGIHQLFRSRIANESAYRRAPDLWSHGYRDVEPRANAGAGGGWTRTASTFDDRADHSSGERNGSTENTAPGAPKYVGSIEGRHLYIHTRRLHPAQHWPCPLLLQSPCRSCSLLECDTSGASQCVAVWKMKAIIHGIDAGESLDDVRDWIRNS